MKISRRIEQINILKSIIIKAKNDLTPGKLIELITLSAKAELLLKNKSVKINKRKVDKELSGILIKYKEYLTGDIKV